MAPGSSILFYFQMCDLAKPAIIKRIGSSLQLRNSLKLTSHTTFLWTTNPFSPEVQAQHQLHWANWNPYTPRCSSGHVVSIVVPMWQKSITMFTYVVIPHVTWLCYPTNSLAPQSKLYFPMSILQNGNYSISTII